MYHKVLKLSLVCNRSKVGSVMILCSCNVLSDRDIRERLGDNPSRRSVGALFRQLGCEPKCGRCIRNILATMDQHRAAMAGQCGGEGACDSCRADEMAA
jgi:bacterioferritin-associated ferredoxin